MKKYIFSTMFVALLALLVGTHAQAAACSIDSFVATPAAVDAGASATLTIKTSNCDTATLAGLDPSNPSQGFTVQDNGSVSTGAITSARAFTLQASAGTATPVTANLTVNVNPVATTAAPSKGFFATIASAIGGFASLVGNAITSIFK